MVCCSWGQRRRSSRLLVEKCYIFYWISWYCVMCKRRSWSSNRRLGCYFCYWRVRSQSASGYKLLVGPEGLTFLMNWWNAHVCVVMFIFLPQSSITFDSIWMLDNQLPQHEYQRLGFNFNHRLKSYLFNQGVLECLWVGSKRSNYGLSSTSSQDWIIL